MDKARKWTDKELAKMEKDIAKIYKEAQSDIDKKWKAYMKVESKKLDSLKAKADNGDEKDKKKYQQELKKYTIENKRYKAMVDQTTTQLAHVNEKAISYLNGKTPNIYAMNYNEAVEVIKDSKLNIAFDLVDEHTVKMLVANKEIDLLPKRLDIPKDKLWNKKMINSQVTQGILQGESISKISKRLQNVTDMNKDSAIRNARTMTTNAENLGRIDSYKELQSQGCEIKKVWIATHDRRVRAWHEDLDGDEKNLDEPFENEYGFIMQPGDYSANPANIYCCRCSLESKIISFNGTKLDGEEVPNNQHDEYDYLNNIEKPQRPRKSDFSNEDDYYKARELYREKKEAYDKKVEEFIEKSLPSKSMTMDEFKDWCNGKGIKIRGDISEVDKDAMTLYAKRMDKLSKDFPDVMTFRTKLPIAKEYQSYEFAYEYTMDFVAEANHGFTFGSDGRDVKSLLWGQADAVCSKYRVKGDGTINQLFDHEFGHNVYDSIKYKKGFDDGFEYRRALEKDLVNSCYGKKGMSEYATTNPDELFAEAFSAWYGGEKTEFAKEFGKFLKRWL